MGKLEEALPLKRESLAVKRKVPYPYPYPYPSPEPSPEPEPEPEPCRAPLYLAIRARIYDVSAAWAFYGPGKSYHGLVARRAARTNPTPTLILNPSLNPSRNPDH